MTYRKEYKVGDRVCVVNPASGYDHLKGMVGTVDDVYEPSAEPYTVVLDEIPNDYLSFAAYELEPCSVPKPIRRGDVVHYAFDAEQLTYRVVAIEEKYVWLRYESAKGPWLGGFVVETTDIVRVKSDSGASTR